MRVKPLLKSKFVIAFISTILLLIIVYFFFSEHFWNAFFLSRISFVLIGVGILFIIGSNSRIKFWIFFLTLIISITFIGYCLVNAIAKKAPDALEEIQYSYNLNHSRSGFIDIGSGKENGIVLANPYSSNKHMRLFYERTNEGMKFQIINVSSNRKIEINGVDINRASLERGDTLKIGRDVYTVQDVGFLTLILKEDSSVKPQKIGGHLKSRIDRRLYSCIMSCFSSDLKEGAMETHIDEELRSVDGVTAVFTYRGRNHLYLSGNTYDDYLGIWVKRDKGDFMCLRDLRTEVKPNDIITLGYAKYRLSYDEKHNTIGLSILSGGYSFPLKVNNSWAVVGNYPTNTVGNYITIPFPGSEAKGILIRKTDGNAIEVKKGAMIRKVEKDKTLSFETQNAGATYKYVNYADRYKKKFLYYVFFFICIAVIYLLVGIINAGNYLFFAMSYLLTVVGNIMLFNLGAFSDLRFMDDAFYNIDSKTMLMIGLVFGIFILPGFKLSSLRDSKPQSLQKWYHSYKSNLQEFHLFNFLNSNKIPLFRRLNIPVVKLCLLWIPFLILLFQIPFGEGGYAIVGSFSVQPLEAVKVALFVYFAHYIVEYNKIRGSTGREQKFLSYGWWKGKICGEPNNARRYVLPIGFVLFALFGLKDMSPILMFASLAVVAVIIGRSNIKNEYVTQREGWVGKLKRIWNKIGGYYKEAFAVLLIAVVTIIIALIMVKSPKKLTVYERVIAWLSPWTYTEYSEQFIGSLWNIKEGDIAGVSFTSRNLDTIIPGIHNDFILSYYINRLGWGGFVLLIVAYIFFFLAGANAYVYCYKNNPKSDEGIMRRLAIFLGLVMFVIQLMVVFSSVLGILPVMGQPLPFMAAGRSHVVLFSFMAVALILFLSSYEGKDRSK